MRHRFFLLLMLCSLAGAALVLVATSRYGVGVSPDSVGYLASARHLARGQGLLLYDGTPLVEQPPFYPITLALVERLLGLDALVASRGLNALLYALIVYGSGRWLARHLPAAPLFSAAGVLFVLFSAPLLEGALMAWSEPLFILLALVYLLNLEAYLAGQRRSSLLLVSCAVALACLTRYIGVALVPAGVATILLFSKSRPGIRLPSALLFAVCSTLPLLLWVMRNYALTATFFGPRSPSRFTLAQNLDLTAHALLSWFIPWQVTTPAPGLVVLAALVVGIALVSASSRWITHTESWRALGPAGLFIISYLGFLLVSSTTIAYDRIDNRLLSPLYVPVLLLLLIWLRTLLDVLAVRISAPLAYGLLAVLLVAWLVHPLRVVTQGTIKRVNGGAGGYNTRLWRESATIGYLQDQHWEGQVLYSNGPDVGYLLTGLEMKWSPLRGSSSPAPAGCALASKQVWPAEPVAYLIWFDHIHRSYLYTVDELRQVAEVAPMVELADGVIYTVVSKACRVAS